MNGLPLPPPATLSTPGPGSMSVSWKTLPPTKIPFGVVARLETRMFGLASLQAEGAATPMDSGAGNRYAYNTVHFGVGLGFIMTRTAIKDNLYKSEFKPNTTSLRISFQQAKEIFGANILNNGATANAAIGGDGLSLLNTAHLVDGGTLGNRPATDIELSEAALEAAYTAIRGFKNSAGLKVFLRPQLLIVPPALEFVADRILYTDGRVGTTNNDENAIKRKGSIPGGYQVMDFLTSTKAWFLKTTAEKGLTYTEREPFETDMTVDFDTWSIKSKAYERYSFWYRDWRGVYGTYPT